MSGARGKRGGDSGGDLLRLCVFICTGGLMLVVGIWGGLTALSAGEAQWLYYRVKFQQKSEKLPVDKVLSVCESAHQRYPYNYFFPDHAAVTALDAAFDADSPEESEALMDAADYWSRIAFSLNPYVEYIASHRARVLEKSGRIPEAVHLWRTVVENEFWNPRHHIYLARLLMLEGNLGEAESELLWGRGSKEAVALKKEISKQRKFRERIGLSADFD